MNQKIFVLGVGAQKAGTSWLRNYLNNRSDADMGFTKEYHIFDSLTIDHSNSFRKQVFRNAERIAQQDLGVKNVAAYAQLFAFMLDRNLYYDYFTARLWPDNILLTGDITPAYAGLEEKILAEIKTKFQTRGIEVKPVFIMREPVSRLQSMVRAQFRKRKIEPNQLQIKNEMEKMQRTEWEKLRSDYATTITRLENVFGSNVFYGFYEKLFTTETIKSLCSYLEINYHPAEIDIRVNASNSGATITKQQFRLFQTAYQETYSFVESHFKDEPIRELWFRPKSVRV